LVSREKERFFSDIINSWDSDVPLALRAFSVITISIQKNTAFDICRKAVLLISRMHLRAFKTIHPNNGNTSSTSPTTHRQTRVGELSAVLSQKATDAVPQEDAPKQIRRYKPDTLRRTLPHSQSYLPPLLLC
jgi:hypothetical protein